MSFLIYLKHTIDTPKLKIFFNSILSVDHCDLLFNQNSVASFRTFRNRPNGQKSKMIGCIVTSVHWKIRHESWRPFMDLLVQLNYHGK